MCQTFPLGLIDATKLRDTYDGYTCLPKRVLSTRPLAILILSFFIATAIRGDLICNITPSQT